MSDGFFFLMSVHVYAIIVGKGQREPIYLVRDMSNVASATTTCVCKINKYINEKQKN
jgi:hypothetical protein